MFEQKPLVFGRLDVDGVVGLLIFRARLDEHAAPVTPFGEPLAEGVVHGEQPFPGRAADLVHPAVEPVAEVFVAKAQGGEDQVFLGAEVLVDRGLRHAGLGGQPVHASRVEAVLVEDLQRLPHQFVALGLSHDSHLEVYRSV